MTLLRQLTKNIQRYDQTCCKKLIFSTFSVATKISLKAIIGIIPMKKTKMAKASTLYNRVSVPALSTLVSSFKSLIRWNAHQVKTAITMNI
jgi:hypothetical protein